MKLCGYVDHHGTYTPLWGVSTLLRKHSNKKQETEECILKLCGYIYHQGTYTPQAFSEKGAGFSPFTGVSALLLKRVQDFLPYTGIRQK